MVIHSQKGTRSTRKEKNNSERQIKADQLNLDKERIVSLLGGERKNDH